MSRNASVVASEDGAGRIAAPRAAELAELIALPRDFAEYARNPRQSLRKLRYFLNARWQLRACTSVGRWPQLHGRVYIENQGAIVLGHQVQILAHFARSVLVSFPRGRLEIGDRTTLNYGTDISATQLVRIGADCLIGTHVIILDNDFHEVTARGRRPESRPVIIGDGVWIGNRAIIMPGVTIHPGAVVGAGSVVMTDVPERSLAMGNPARVIKKF